MADNISLITCPTDCATDNVWPAIPVEQDCPSYEQTLAQVCDLIIVPTIATDIWDDWSGDYPTPAFVLGSIDNTVADNTKAHRMTGIGGVAEPESVVLQYPKLQERIDEETYTLTHRIMNMSNTQNDMLDKLECGALNFTFWYLDLGGYVYGYEGGIVPYSVTVQRPHGAGNDDRLFADIIITWKSTMEPDRGVIPADFGDPV